MSKKISLLAVMKYRFDNFMSRGGVSIFIALLTLFAAAFAVMAAIRFAANQFLPDDTLKAVNDQLWRVFLQISDAGAIAEDGDSSVVNKIIGIVTVFLGLVLFSSLVAFITSQFERMLEELKRGKSRVAEKDHTLILGFGGRTVEIIRELITANESSKKAAVAVLADMEKDLMDEFFRERIENRKSTRIITRSGVTSHVQTLERMSVSDAKSIIILNDAEPNAEFYEKELADAKVIKTIMAVIACCGDAGFPPITAELHSENRRRLAKKISENIYLIEEHSVLAKLIVQTSRITGLALVYDSLVGFDGCEFYFYAPKNGWNNRTYGELQFHFTSSSVLGIRDGSGTVRLNPSPAEVLSDDMELILIADDDSQIVFSKKPFKTARISSEPAPAASKRPERQLVVGWSMKAAVIVDEYAEYLVDGSEISVIVREISDEMNTLIADLQKKHPAVVLTLIEANAHSEEAMAQIRPETYDNVIILKQDGGDPELSDAETIALLLQFRQRLESAGRDGESTQLISEVADSDNIDVILEVGVNDFLISNKFVSKLYAQVSEEPDILKVYDDLFSEEGAEIYCKPLARFMKEVPAKVKFGDLCAAAQLRGESCFGVRIKSEENNPESGFGICINPPKEQVFKLTLEDSLLTLAENEL